MNTEQNGQANDRLLPNIIVLTRANGELAIMKALRKETYRYRCCSRGSPPEHSRDKVRMPSLVLTIYDGRRSLLEQTKIFENTLNDCRIKLDFKPIATLSDLREDLFIAYHHAKKDFPQQVRGNDDIPCLEINIRTGSGIVPLLETITSREGEQRGLVVFFPIMR